MAGKTGGEDLVEHYLGGVPVEIEEVEDVDVPEHFVLRGLAEIRGDGTHRLCRWRRGGIIGSLSGLYGVQGIGLRFLALSSRGGQDRRFHSFPYLEPGCLR